MDFTQWHAIVLGSIAFFAMILWGFRCIFRVITKHGYLPFLKHIFYPPLIENSPVFGRTTRFHAILILGLVISNALYIALPKPNVGNLISRSGLMSTVNFILLSLGNHLKFLFTNCGIAFQDYDRMHQWIGAITLIEGLMHSVISIVSDDHTFGSNTISQISKWTVCLMPIDLIKTNTLISGNFSDNFDAGLILFYSSSFLVRDLCSCPSATSGYYYIICVVTLAI